MKTLFSTALYCFLTFLVAGTLSAQTATAEPLEALLEAYVVTTDDAGEEVLTKANSAKPGDLILYEAVFTNLGETSLIDLAPTVPIPAGLEYQSFVAVRDPATASLDGSTFIPFSEALLPPEDPESSASTIQAVRWSISDLAPGDSFTARVYAQLSEG